MEFPAGQFRSEMASNVARMCGPAQNSACPTVLSSTLGDLVADNGNDGNVRTKVHTLTKNEPNTFRIDLEQTRHVQFVKIFNRFDCCWDRLRGAHTRVGSSPLWSDNAVCADAEFNADSIQKRTCNFNGRYIFIVLLTGHDLNFEELQVFSNCTNCPANAVSLPGSTSPAACGWPADSYEETQVLNPSEDSRTYSSVLTVHKFSQLDSLHNEVAWIAGTNMQGQWMEIDASEAMFIVGVITQGRGENIQQYVTNFRVEYRLGDSKGENIMLPGEFSMPYVRTEHVFASLIFARHIRIIALEWVSYIAMRAALIVKSCSSCMANAVLLQGSTAETACECRADAYKSTSESNSRAIALVPRRAQFSSLANRNQSFYAPTAVFDRTLGLLGNTACRPTLELVSHYFSGTSHILNDSSTRANRLAKWAPVAADSTGPGWTGSPRIAFKQSNPVWKLASYGNKKHALNNTLVLLGIMLTGITEARFYRSSADAFNVAD